MQLWNFPHNVLSQKKKTMLKVSNRSTRKICLLILKIRLKASERRHQFAIKSLLSVLLSSLTTHNFNNSKPIYIITKIFDSWNFKISTFFYFWKKQPQKQTNFSTFCLIFKRSPFQYHKAGHPIFWNLLHFEMVFWNVSWKRIVSSKRFWQKSREKHYKWDNEKNGIACSTARNLKTAYLWNFYFN